MPSWARQPFEEFIDFTENVNRVVHLSIAGISMHRAVPDVIKTLAEYDAPKGSSISKDAEERVKRAEFEAELAAREVQEDFPLLHSQAVVTMWSALESLARNVLAAWLTNAPEKVYSNDRLRKLRVPLLEYERLEPDERVPYIVEVIEREVDAPLKHGVARFEELMALVGLCGEVDEKLRRSIFELSQVRNVIVHRGGRVDRRFMQACPWVPVKPGDRIMAGMYFGAVHDYALECIQRARVAFGLRRYRPAESETLRALPVKPA
jgi:hypothetical protein